MPSRRTATLLTITQPEQSCGWKHTAPTKRVKVAEQGFCRERAGDVVDGVCVDCGWASPLVFS